MNQYNLSIDLNDGTVDGTSIVFKHNIESALETATAITLQHYSTLSAVPAYYDSTEKKLYPVSAMTHYWTVDGNTMTYT